MVKTVCHMCNKPIRTMWWVCPLHAAFLFMPVHTSSDKQFIYGEEGVSHV